MTHRLAPPGAEMLDQACKAAGTEVMDAYRARHGDRPLTIADVIAAVREAERKGVVRLTVAQAESLFERQLPSHFDKATLLWCPVCSEKVDQHASDCWLATAIKESGE